MRTTTPLLSLVAASLVLTPFAATQAQNEQFIPALVYRTGPYAAGGSGFCGRHGRLHGAAQHPRRRARWCGRSRGRSARRPTTPTAGSNATNASRARARPARASCIRSRPASPTGSSNAPPPTRSPLISMGYGRTDATNGKIFPYVFPLVTNYWSQNTAKIKYIGMKEGGMGNLEGKKIANLYHESSYGKETIPVLDKQAEMYGFEVRHFPIPHPGLDQKATWLEIARRYKPDWVILRGWGVMNPTALKEASRRRLPGHADRRGVVERRRGRCHPCRQGGGRLRGRGLPSLRGGFPGHSGDPRHGARCWQGPHFAAARRDHLLQPRPYRGHPHGGGDPHRAG